MSAPRTRATLAALAGALTFTIVFTACNEGTATEAASRAPLSGPQYTASSGSQSTLLGRATFSQEGNFKVKRITGDWQVEVKAHPELDLAVQQIVFQPGGQSGWHSHPGPVFIQVVSGTMTFYESVDPTCTPIVRSAGQGFAGILDAGEHAHMARNETGSPATVVAVYLAPPGAALRIDQPNPGNCPF
jgi:hypothetical protein